MVHRVIIFIALAVAGGAVLYCLMLSVSLRSRLDPADEVLSLILLIIFVLGVAVAIGSLLT